MTAASSTACTTFYETAQNGVAMETPDVKKAEALLGGHFGVDNFFIFIRFHYQLVTTLLG